MPYPRWTPPTTPFMFVNASVGRKALAAALKRGDVVELHPGVYIAAGALCEAPAERHAQRALARQVRSPDLVASHETAALAHGLPLLYPDRSAEEPPRFTRAPGPSVRSSRLVSVRPLPPAHVTDMPAGPLAGLRLTTPARTAMDLAASLDLCEALMALDFVARRAAAGYLVSKKLRGAITDRVLKASLQPLERARVARPHRNRRATRALGLAYPGRESAGESLSFAHMVLAGLPLPECQVLIQTDRGEKWVDFDWPEYGVSGECHGAVKYDGSLGSTEGVLVDEAERQHAVEGAGRSVVSWDMSEMMAVPHAVIGRIGGRLKAHGWDGFLE